MRAVDRSGCAAGGRRPRLLRLRRLLAVTVLVVAGAVLPHLAIADAPKAVPAAMTTPVILVHGYSSGTCPGTNVRNEIWGAQYLMLAWSNWAGPLLPVSFYECDTHGVDITGFGPNPPAGETTGTTDAMPRAGYTQADGIEQIAHDLAWFVFHAYSRAGTPANLVGGSMGGLIMRYALYRVAAQDPGFPPYLIVPRAVTISTPHAGFGTLATNRSFCRGTLQCLQMATDSPFMADLTANGTNPQGFGGTAWTVIGSSAGCDYVPVASSLAMPMARQIDFVSPCYTHANYVWDWATSADATILDARPGSADVTKSQTVRVLSFVTRVLMQTTTGAPTEPVDVTTYPSKGGALTVTWAAPVGDGGSPLTRYDVYQSDTPDDPGTKVATVTAPRTSWTSPPLIDGARYYFRVAAHSAQRAGPASRPVDATADDTAPTVSITDPNSPFQLTDTVTVGYSATDAGSGVATYDVDYRVATWNGGFSAYRSLASATPATYALIAGLPAHEYCVRVRTRDNAGNVSAWTRDACTAIPLDDRSLAATTAGWARSSASNYYRGTATATATEGAALRLRGVLARRIGLVVTTCPTCGVVDVYVDGRLWNSVDTYSSAPADQVIHMPRVLDPGSVTLDLVNASAGKRVIIDGLGAARR